MAFLLYKTDEHHTRKGRVLLAVCDMLGIAVKCAEEDAIKYGFPLTHIDLESLAYKQQTQGYGGGGEYLIEEVESNKLIL